MATTGEPSSGHQENPEISEEGLRGQNPRTAKQAELHEGHGEQNASTDNHDKLMSMTSMPDKHYNQVAHFNTGFD